MINSYLTFKLGEEVFAANVTKVLNILEMLKITKVPKAPAYMKGIINLRGQVLPLIDTRMKFEMTETEFTTNTCILVLEVELNGENMRVGALVDAVQEVLEIDDKSIQPAPSLGSKYKTEFIIGVTQVNENFIMLLDMDMIFSTDELIVIKTNAEGKLTEETTETLQDDVKEKPVGKVKSK